VGADQSTGQAFGLGPAHDPRGRKHKASGKQEPELQPPAQVRRSLGHREARALREGLAGELGQVRALLSGIDAWQVVRQQQSTATRRAGSSLSNAATSPLASSAGASGNKRRRSNPRGTQLLPPMRPGIASNGKCCAVLEVDDESD